MYKILFDIFPFIFSKSQLFYNSQRKRE